MGQRQECRRQGSAIVSWLGAPQAVGGVPGDAFLAVVAARVGAGVLAHGGAPRGAAHPLPPPPGDGRGGRPADPGRGAGQGVELLQLHQQRLVRLDGRRPALDSELLPAGRLPRCTGTALHSNAHFHAYAYPQG